MKNVLLLVHDDKGQQARLQAALDLTRALGGHLHCLDVVPLPLLSDPMLGGGVTTVLYDEAPREADNAAELKRRLETEDVAWTLEEVRGDFAECLLQAARTADVVVLNKKLDRFPDPEMLSIAGRMLVEGDAVLVAVDEDCRRLDLAGAALVAWDGSETAMRTVRKAMPLLRLAGSVTILQAGVLPDDALPATEAASYLSRHGVKPEIEISPDGRNVPEQLLQAARQHQAMFCVMGGFGHSRLREAVFGGVTRELLEGPGLSLVLGH
jgi:nucleotide-binding universal stress UspA family protein